MVSSARGRVVARVAVLALLAVMASAAPAEASTSSEVKVRECGYWSVMRPSSLTLSCADGYMRLDRLTWHSWGGRQARATGIQKTNTCYPACVAGESVYMPVEVVLNRRQSGYYTRMTVTPMPMARVPVLFHPGRIDVWDVGPPRL